jgi:hypothetical protein
MSGSDLALLSRNVTVPAPLSLRLRSCPFNSVHSVIVVGPAGAVELQIRPALIDLHCGGMSIEDHSRQPTAAALEPTPDCEVLDAPTCYHDGVTLRPGSEFERWFRVRNGQAIADELVRQYQATTWTLDGAESLDNEDPGAPAALEVPSDSVQLPARQVPPWV